MKTAMNALYLAYASLYALSLNSQGLISYAKNKKKRLYQKSE